MTTHAKIQGSEVRKTKTRRRKRQKNVRFATWNIKSLNKRDQELEKELRERKIDICALQETHKKGKGQSVIGEYLLAYSGVSKEVLAKEGVGLLIHKNLVLLIIETQYISERIIKVKLNINNRAHNVISIYAPESCRTQAVREDFYTHLQEVIDEIPTHERTIILGDFNARIGNSVIPEIKQRFNEDVINENGKLLINLCADNELRINNTFFNHPIQYKYTYQNTRGHCSMIDYMITNRHIKPAQIIDVRCLTTANIGSDHNLLLCKI